MAIRNYTSKKSPASTAGKMQEILAESGADSVSIEYKNGNPVAVTFEMNVEGKPLFFRLAPDPKAMLEAMKKDKNIPKCKCKHKQALRTAWKNKHDWLIVQLAEIATGQAMIEQLLLGYAVTNTGQTLYKRLRDDFDFQNKLTDSRKRGR